MVNKLVIELSQREERKSAIAHFTGKQESRKQEASASAEQRALASRDRAAFKSDDENFVQILLRLELWAVS
jgi:hypothetical protein